MNDFTQNVSLRLGPVTRRTVRTGLPDAEVEGMAGAAATRGARCIQQTQIGKYHTRSGHGFAAEDANALGDLLKGRRVSQVGKSNTLSGPDRIVNGIKIQTKYCRTPSATFKEAFDSAGSYRYGDQVLEVPRGQRSGVVGKMADAIREGRVPGVTDPAKAESMVLEGRASYIQAKRIARPGNFDSLLFDSKVHIANAVLTSGVAFVAAGCRKPPPTADKKPALGDVAIGAVQAGAKSLLTGVATSQLVRTRFARQATVIVRSGLKQTTRTGAGRRVVNAVASASCGKAVRGIAATNHVARLLRSSIIGSTVSFGVATAPNIGRALVGRMTWSQVGRRGAESFASNLGGMAGWTACFTLGSMACATVMTGGGALVVATIIGTVGSAAAGEGSACLVRLGINKCVGAETPSLQIEVVPAWLETMLAQQRLLPSERHALIQRLRPQLNRYRRFDRLDVDAEAFEKAKSIVSDHLDEIANERCVSC